MSENLKTPWKKGQSGNPNGRPKKGEAMTDLLKFKLETGKTKEQVVQRLIDIAMSEDLSIAFQAIRYIFDRTDGKPVETVRNEDQDKLVDQLDKVLKAVKGELQG